MNRANNHLPDYGFDFKLSEIKYRNTNPSSLTMQATSQLKMKETYALRQVSANQNEVHFLLNFEMKIDRFYTFISYEVTKKHVHQTTCK